MSEARRWQTYRVAALAPPGTYLLRSACKPAPAKPFQPTGSSRRNIATFRLVARIPHRPFVISDGEPPPILGRGAETVRGRMACGSRRLPSAKLLRVLRFL